MRDTDADYFITRGDIYAAMDKKDLAKKDLRVNVASMSKRKMNGFISHHSKRKC